MVLHQMLSYETLRLIWWGLLGVLLLAYAVMDGFDLGVGMLLPFAARTDLERRACTTPATGPRTAASATSSNSISAP